MGPGLSFRHFVRLAGVLLALACFLPVPLPGGSAGSEQIALTGLRQAVEILVDRWGVPHLYAHNEDDLFFAQGFNAARDRLFQIDLWRRRGLGRLAEVFGPEFVEQDKAARLFLFRGDMKTEWAQYSPDAERIAQDFTAGINAYVDWLVTHPERMPFEFRKLNYQPARWSPDDVVRIRSHGLTGNLQDEVARARVVCAAGLQADTVRSRLAPPWQTHIPEGLDPCLPRNVLKMFNLGTQPVRFAPPSAKSAESALLAGASGGLASEELAQSNNWVIAAKKSATGHALMANDPHREYSEPSLRYIVDLNSPTLHVTGIGEPAVPGVSNGHNDWIAFGGTYFAIDQEDLYVYELNPADHNQYRYRNGWESFRAIREEIKVKGQPAMAAELKFTRHGPVIYVEQGKLRAYALRTDWTEPGTAPYLVSLDYMRARNFAQFTRALERWATPPINHVYADVRGNIGWAPAGFAPIRPNWDGLLPVPGDGRYEWSGRWRGDQLPRIYNPPSGYITTSNEMNLPAGYPYKERKLGFEWSSPFRHQRIDEVLSPLKRVRIEDSMTLQNDVVSIPARRLLALLRTLPASDDSTTQAALRLLQAWNASVDADSGPAALHEVWFTRHLLGAYKEAVLGRPASDSFEAPDPAAMLDALERPETVFSGDAAGRRNHLLLTTLAAAYKEMEQLQGSDPRQWSWGKLQYNLSEHPLSPLVGTDERERINVGPIPKNGSRFTPNASAYRAGDFRQMGGPSARLILEAGNWDNSRAVNHPGQSGDPESPHYRDLAPLWRSGQYFPLLYTRQAVEASTEKRITLVPRPALP